jgi:MSHA biogenesis protein MshL
VPQAVSEDNRAAQDAPPPLIVPKQAKVREIDPMKGLTFDFSAVDARVRTVIYAMAVDRGLNVVFSKDVNADNLFTGNFVSTPMRDAVELIMDIADLNYEIRGNIIYVSRYSTMNYNLPYMAVTAKPTASLGGDVVGGADRDGNTNLKGEYTLEYEEPEAVDFYTQLEANITALLKSDAQSNFSINRLSSSISVYTTRSNHNRLKSLLDNIIKNSIRQVQIEAKIMEVALSDGWSYGIDWSRIFSSSDGSVRLVQSLASGVSGAGQMTVVTGTFNGVISAVAQYGKVDTLANPRITVMNGQSAMITAGQIRPYWDRTLNLTESAGGTSLQTYTYEKYSVLDGVMVGVTAFIHDDGSVMLNVLPITTQISGEAEIKDSQGSVQATAPIVEVKESGTVVRVEDGSMLVIGGLITNSKSVTNTRIPVLGDIPLLGYLFNSEKVEYQKRELVIFIKPTVIYGESKVTVR